MKEKDKVIEQYQRRLLLRDDEIKRLQNNAFLGDENLEEIKVRYNVDFYREQNEQLKRQNELLLILLILEGKKISLKIRNYLLALGKLRKIRKKKKV